MVPVVVSKGSGSRRRSRWAWPLAAVALGVAALAVPGCGVMGDAPYTETRTAAVAQAAGSALSVRTENGRVAVRRGGAEKEMTVVAKIRAATRERLEAARVVTEPLATGGFAVSVAWPEGGRRSGEGCSFEITVPGTDGGADGVDVQTSNGAIEVIGLAGPAVLVTSNGSITVIDQGAADGRAGTAGGLIGRARVQARTSNGAVSVVGASGPVDATTSNGSASVALTPGNPGPVAISTRNGGVTLAVGPAFTGLLTVGTSNGSVGFSGCEGVKVTTADRQHAAAAFGDGAGSPSTIETSNGGISVTRLAR